jgi:hypothetical protein
MKYDGSRTGRFEIAQVPLFEWSEDEQRFKAIDDGQTPLPCASWCRICVDIQRSMEQNPSMGDMSEACGLCHDCSDFPEWTI